MNTAASSMPMRSIPTRLPVTWGLAALALVLVVVGWMSQHSEREATPGDVQVSRSLLFRDVPGGDILITDAKTGEQVARVQGEQGFIRGILRALNRSRKQRGLGPDGTFELTRYRDGRLVISDRSTGEQLDLGAFGPTNIGSFAPFIGK
ncbi:MAG: photosynthetic complex assembly protein PuhC [Betaproteobacteria bacterium]|nr:photosynthetic complex assembly protein PuhC [Betaproteobacteria bacterium]